MEAISSAASIVTLIATAAKASERLLLLKNRHNDIERTALEVSLSLQKILVWQENWSSQARNTNVSANTLWGVQGWTTVQTLLDKIVRTGEEIERLLRIELEESQKTQPKLRWRKAIDSIRNKQRVGQQREVRVLASSLNRYVDELWIFSESQFDSRHGPLAIKSKSIAQDTLLQCAVQSRAGSLKLYDLCLDHAENYNLEMDLLDNGMAWKDLSHRDGAPLALTYSLVIEPRENELRKLDVKQVREIDVSSDEIAGSIERENSDFRLFRPQSHDTVIKVPQHRRGSQHYLRIAQGQSRTVHLKASPESLARILEGMENSSHLSTKEYLSTEAKAKIALKVAECGFFLLGTPWFSSLSSNNLRRSNDFADANLSFMLRTQALDYRDLISDDPGALTETSQLFRLGVILMEIALDTPDAEKYDGRLEHDLHWISKLPLVEKAMGAQYCKATAFCLQDRKNRFAGPEKYEGKLYTEWETYLARFLEDYHSQVYLR